MATATTLQQTVVPSRAAAGRRRTPLGDAFRTLRRQRIAMAGLAVVVVWLCLAALAPVLPIQDPNFQDIPNKLRPPGPGHVFGTDDLGRDMVSRVVYGARVSVPAGIAVIFCTGIIGCLLGAVAGYLGGWVDNLLMRAVDVMLSLPILFVILVASRFFGNGNVFLIVVIFGLFSWMGVSRLVRSLFLSLREQDFVEAARAVGVSDRRIIFRHILPNAISPIVVIASLIVAANIISEAFVSFLGFGITTQPTWGNILANALTFIPQGNWWWPFFPGLAIVLTVLAVNFVGDGLRDALDPRSRA